jgi:hypothetical protein
MELVGEEKRIQALFCELALEEESRGPAFESVWRRAQVIAALNGPSHTVRDSGWLIRTVGGSKWPSLNAQVRMSAFGLSLAAAVLILTLFFFNWSTPVDPQRQLTINAPTEESPATPSRQLVALTPAKKRPHKVVTRRATRARDTILQEVAAISSWQSPTQAFLASPTDTFLKSLPQLNQSVKEMESFLPTRK